ncbi:MAG: hypothetical protein JXR22_02525 [Prolixibacteraceae bacterium]|nr:hypothetical protein [Prolixibacteraceae bacterium]
MADFYVKVPDDHRSFFQELMKHLKWEIEEIKSADHEMQDPDDDAPELFYTDADD